MNESGDQERQFRRFLLGQQEEDERQLVEENLMVDDKYRGQVLLAEETLIEDYLDEILSKDDHEAFETCFGATAQQRRKVEIASVLRDYSSPKVRDADQSQPRTAPTRRWSYPFVIKNPVVFASIAAAMLLIIGVGAWQGVRFWRENNETTKQISEVESELFKLNSAPVAVSTYRLALASVSTRDANDASTLSMPFSAQIVEFQLMLTGTIHPHYTAELSKIGTTEKYRIDGLHAQATENGQAVVVKIPSRLLTRGDYRLSLQGTSDVGEYNFQVRSAGSGS